MFVRRNSFKSQVSSKPLLACSVTFSALIKLVSLTLGTRVSNSSMRCEKLRDSAVTCHCAPVCLSLSPDRSDLRSIACYLRTLTVCAFHWEATGLVQCVTSNEPGWREDRTVLIAENQRPLSAPPIVSLPPQVRLDRGLLVVSASKRTEPG